MSIDKKTVEPGGDVTISVNVKNEGKVGGSHLLELSLDGKIVDNKSVKLSAGQSDTVPFTVSKENTGSYRVSVGNQTGSFEVKKPSKFEITNYSMDRKIVKTGSTLEVSVVVKNVGNKKSSRSVVLYLDGEAVKSKPVSLEVGKSKSIAFKISENKIGSHKVSIGGYSENFRVLPPETFELRNKVENLKEEVEVRKDRIANLQGKIENLKEGVKAREDKLSDLQGKLEESRGELNSKKSKLRMVQNELEKERKEKEGIPMRWVVFGIFLALIVGLVVGRKT
ncbi:hypothetical protein AKJ41_04350 [candidate division MSBL1 archaeon SCGC-AAA259O05]|uniref:CARDB domain-containing protein n=1 Tax=candidate division MSBL1 archaeon SCGC-AAA259O05 TaxID=1698271 RepID=A0A133V144_9EURY|nr:hypothetical protein AKJ41_04350 [candidate division MSBL1 archaeon SCGC-AAA259O05]